MPCTAMAHSPKLEVILKGLNKARKSLQWWHLWFLSNICAFCNRIFEGIYVSCKAPSSFAHFNVNFGASTSRGTLHRSIWSFSLRIGFFWPSFFMHWINWYCCSGKSTDTYGSNSSNENTSVFPPPWKLKVFEFELSNDSFETLVDKLFLQVKNAPKWQKCKFRELWYILWT